jgi:hypothetical protein
LVNLGFVPPALAIAGLEISRWTSALQFRVHHPELEPYGLLSSGDAHRLSEMARRTVVLATRPTVRELRLALAGEAGIAGSPPGWGSES